MSNDSVQKGFIVRGRVQGVGFRWWTRANASELGLGGTVRNLVDGSVEVHLRGPESAVAEMEDRLRHGPSFADVSAIEVVPSEEPLPESFEVRF